MRDGVDVKIRCETCSEWVVGSTTEQFLECDCGQQYMISVTGVNMQSKNS